MEALINGLPYVGVTVVAGLIGAALVVFWTPGAATRAYLLHFAAGAILAATSVELFPEIERLSTSRILDLVGFTLGGACMLVLSHFSAALSRRWAGPAGLVLASSADVFLDGIALGATISVTRSAGFALAIALATEMLFLVLSVGSNIRASGWQPVKSALIVSLITLGFAIGGITGLMTMSGASTNFVAAVLAFGAAVFLYLVTEELLVEAHKAKQRQEISILVFFLGFLAIFGLSTMAPT